MAFDPDAADVDVDVIIGEQGGSDSAEIIDMSPPPEGEVESAKSGVGKTVYCSFAIHTSYFEQIVIYTIRFIVKNDLIDKNIFLRFKTHFP